MRSDRSFLFHYDQTGRSMYEWVRLYYRDLKKYGLLDLPLDEFFDVVKNIPFLEDHPDIELLPRPEIMLNNLDGLDCKKKSILVGSYLYGQDPPIPFRFVAISEDPEYPRDPHHVFTQAFMSVPPGDPPKWVNIDPTYPEYELYEGKTQALYAEELKP